MTELLYGKIPILETLRAKRRSVHQFFYLDSSKSEQDLNEVMKLCQVLGLKISPVSRDWFARKFPPGVLTQGWALECAPYPYREFSRLLQKLEGQTQGTLLALDQIQDPQNLGAVLRSAECTGVDGVLICTDRAVGITPAVVKAAAGASEYLEICQVVNLARALEEAKRVGFWTVGTSLSGETNALQFDWPEKSLVVLGSEEKGMRRLVQEKCDFLIRLPLLGKISSLNVAATAAVCLYEMVRNRSI